MKPNYLSQSPSSRLIRDPRSMTPTTKKMIQWIGALRAVSSANMARTVLSSWKLPLDITIAEGFIKSHP